MKLPNESKLGMFILKLEKKWVTTDCHFQLYTSLLGMNVVDKFRLAWHYGIFQRKDKEIDEDLTKEA